MKVKKRPIDDCKIVEKIFKKDRWYVVIEPSVNGRKTISHAHYNWLIGNPAFLDIPKGYTIHHLDHDEQNDDISNLALMQKHHHSAHHWKYKRIDSDVKIGFDFNINQRDYNFPTTEPKIYQRKDNGKFMLCFYEKLSEMPGRNRTLTSYRGRKFNTKEDAEWAKKQIWPIRHIML